MTSILLTHYYDSAHSADNILLGRFKLPELNFIDIHLEIKSSSKMAENIQSYDKKEYLFSWKALFANIF